MTTTAPSAGSAGAAGARASADRVPVRDVWVRLFHWSRALAVGFQLLSGLTGWKFLDRHGTVGGIALAPVAFRLLWGVVGSPNARLTYLCSGPQAVPQHFRELLHRDLPPERGHNAAGSWSVLAPLLIVGVQAGTGPFIADRDELLEGPSYAGVSSATSDWLWRIHQWNANLIQKLVVLHIATIAVYWLWAKRNLVRPMSTGRARDATAAVPAQPIAGAPWKGTACALVAGVGTGPLVGWFRSFVPGTRARVSRPRCPPPPRRARWP